MNIEKVKQSLLYVKLKKKLKGTTFYKNLTKATWDEYKQFELGIYEKLSQNPYSIINTLKKYFTKDTFGEIYQENLNYIENAIKLKIADYEEFERAMNFLIVSYALDILLVKSIEEYGNQVFFIKEEFWRLLNQTDFPENIEAKFISPPYNAFVIKLENYPKREEELKLTEMFVKFEEIKDKNLLYISIIYEHSNGKMFNKLPIQIYHSREDTLEKIKKEIDKNIENFLNATNAKGDIALQTAITIKSLSRIIINFLLYLNHINDDTSSIETAPEKLIKRKEFYEKQNNRKKLEKINKEISRYTKIHIVGTKTAQYYYRELEKAGKPKKPHWRRGHIRFLKHPKYKKDWTYVRPALIGKGKIDKDKERIYTT